MAKFIRITKELFDIDTIINASFVKQVEIYKRENDNIWFIFIDVDGYEGPTIKSKPFAEREGAANIRAMLINQMED